MLIIFINSNFHTNDLMVINKNTKGISYDAMINSKKLNSFFEDPDDKGTSDEEE